MKEKKEKDIYKSTIEMLRTKPEEPEATKKRATLYIDKAIFKDFQKLCSESGRSVSEVVQNMMIDVLKLEK